MADRLEAVGRELREATAARDAAMEKATGLVRDLHAAGGLNMAEVARVLGVSRPTVYAMLRDE